MQQQVPVTTYTTYLAGPNKGFEYFGKICAHRRSLFHVFHFDFTLRTTLFYRYDECYM